MKNYSSVTNLKDQKLFFNEQGKLHRLDGPAILFFDGYEEWYLNGKLHREDGPAITYISGHKQWYLNGDLFYEDEWKQEVLNLKLKRILNL
jgi:hypothetical protein